jgi:hypothetical protein
MFPEETARINCSFENPASHGPLICYNWYYAWKDCTATRLTLSTSKAYAKSSPFPKSGQRMQTRMSSSRSYPKERSEVEVRSRELKLKIQTLEGMMCDNKLDVETCSDK